MMSLEMRVRAKLSGRRPNRGHVRSKDIESSIRYTACSPGRKERSDEKGERRAPEGDAALFAA